MEKALLLGPDDDRMSTILHAALNAALATDAYALLDNSNTVPSVTPVMQLYTLYQSQAAL
jgi:hypothetical protein